MAYEDDLAKRSDDEARIVSRYLLGVVIWGSYGVVISLAGFPATISFGLLGAAVAAFAILCGVGVLQVWRGLLWESLGWIFNRSVSRETRRNFLIAITLRSLSFTLFLLGFIATGDAVAAVIGYELYPLVSFLLFYRRDGERPHEAAASERLVRHILVFAAMLAAVATQLLGDAPSGLAAYLRGDAIELDAIATGGGFFLGAVAGVLGAYDNLYFVRVRNALESNASVVAGRTEAAERRAAIYYLVDFYTRIVVLAALLLLTALWAAILGDGMIWSQLATLPLQSILILVGAAIAANVFGTMFIQTALSEAYAKKMPVSPAPLYYLVPIISLLLFAMVGKQASVEALISYTVLFACVFFLVIRAFSLQPAMLALFVCAFNTLLLIYQPFESFERSEQSLFFAEIGLIVFSIMAGFVLAESRKTNRDLSAIMGRVPAATLLDLQKYAHTDAPEELARKADLFETIVAFRRKNPDKSDFDDVALIISNERSPGELIFLAALALAADLAVLLHARSLFEQLISIFVVLGIWVAFFIVLEEVRKIPERAVDYIRLRGGDEPKFSNPSSIYWFTLSFSVLLLLSGVIYVHEFQ